MKQIIRYSLVLMTSLVVTGCQFNGPIRGDTTNNPELEMNSIRVLDQSLINQKKNVLGLTKGSARIVIENEGVTSSELGNAEVFVVIRNLTDEDIQIECQTTWFDVNKVPLDGPSSWDTVFLTARSVGTFKQKSITSRAVNYMVDIREGK